MKCVRSFVILILLGRLPRGRRGLKSTKFFPPVLACLGRLPRGRRGLKYLINAGAFDHGEGRLPRGRRGLKCYSGINTASSDGSPPSREAWIEMVPGTSMCSSNICRLPRGRRGLKFFVSLYNYIVSYVASLMDATSSLFIFVYLAFSLYRSTFLLRLIVSRHSGHIKCTLQVNAKC